MALVETRLDRTPGARHDTSVVTTPAGLAPGTRIGVFRIEARLGAGAMGEVYRAHDTSLGRDVAIKVLRPDVANDTDRLARIRREARVLGTMNHPHIGTIFGLLEDGGLPALVLEYVDGPLLSDRIAGGPLPIDQAVRIAVQIAQALESAHERGVIHRDLKPANIKLTAAGDVKVLDFGIAKAVEGDESDGAITMTGVRTQPGLVIGSPAYMSPEQARGQGIDRRTDIWAFGCVLFEMLAQRPPFGGATVTDVLAGVLERPPEWQALPAHTPASVRWLLERCLDKDPRERLRDIGDARIALTRPASSAPATQPAAKPRVAMMAAAATAIALAALAVGLAIGRSGRSSVAAARVAFALPPPPDTVFGIGQGPAAFAPNAELVTMAVSPDGARIGFIATGAEGTQIWMRDVGAAEPRKLDGTAGATTLFWSPDGSSIGFFADGKLKRLDLPDSRPVIICDVSANANYTGTWGRDVILLASNTEILQVSPKGGVPAVARALDAGNKEIGLLFPWFLPDGKRYLYTVRDANREGVIELGESGAKPIRLISAISNAQWVDPDFLLFVRDGSLIAQRFDVTRGAPIGDPIAIADQIQYSRSTARGNFASSATGVVLYQPHLDEAQLVWVDRTGREVGRVEEAADYTALRLSPDGRSVLVSQNDPRLGTFDLWTIDLARGVHQRVTFDPTSELLGAWMPGGKGIVFTAERGGPPHVFAKDLSSGTERELVPASDLQVVSDVSADGATVVYVQRNARGSNLWAVSTDGKSAPRQLDRSATVQSNLRFAPVGDRVILTSNESGRSEVYAASFSALAARVPISSGGGASGRWSSDGKEILYLSTDRRIMSVRVTGNGLTFDAPRPLFTLPVDATWRTFEIAPDGRLLAAVTSKMGNAQPMTAVLNWATAK